MNPTLPAGQWELDLGTGILRLCDQSQEMFGLPAGDAGLLREEEWVPRIHAEDLPVIRSALRASLVERRVYAERFRVLRPDGSVREIFGVGSAPGEPTEAARIVGWNVDVALSADVARYWVSAVSNQSAGQLEAPSDAGEPGRTMVLSDDPDSVDPERLLEAAETILNIRHTRAQMLGNAMLTGPAFDLFLTLYVLSAKRETVSVSALGRAARIPPSSALRWIAYLVDKGLVMRSKSEGDRRIISVRPTDLGRKALHRFLALQ